MIIDKLLTFSDNVQVKTTGPSAEVVVGGDDIAKKLNLLVQVDASYAGVTSLSVKVQTYDEKTGDNPKDPVDVLTLPAVTSLAKLAAGERPWGFVKLPYGLKKYVRLSYTVAGTWSAGALSAFLTPSVES